jgi:hypothetical protein
VAIGSTRKTVTRILGNLTRDRLVERRDDEIVILHADELSRLCASPEVTVDGDEGPSLEKKCDLSMPVEPWAPGGAS